jgi:hypothetical protein
MKTYMGVESQLHAFLNSALDGGEWLISRSGSFTLGARIADTNWIGGWMGPRVDLDAAAKRKTSYNYPCREWSPYHPARSLVTILTELPTVKALFAVYGYCF